MHAATAFPLVQLPQRVVFVDDNAAWLQAMRLYVATGERRLFFDQAAQALSVLQRGQAAWDSLRDLLHAYASGERSQLLAGVAAGYFNQGARFRLNTVIVLDYAMPGMNGMELAHRLRDVAGAKLLLTGEAGPGLAVEAFNADLIHAYRPKARCSEALALERVLNDMHQRTCHDFGAVLEAGAAREQLQLLRDPHVAAALWARSQALGWVEHVVIAEPFGILGLARSGTLQWLQLETPPPHAVCAPEAGSTAPLIAHPEARADAPPDPTCAARLAARAHSLREHLGCIALTAPLAEIALCADPPLAASIWELPLPVLDSASWGREADRSETEQARTLAAQLGAAQRHHARVQGAAGDAGTPLLLHARQAAEDTLRQVQAFARHWIAHCAPHARMALRQAALAEGVALDMRTHA